jgi:hypothetical protein
MITNAINNVFGMVVVLTILVVFFCIGRVCRVESNEIDDQDELRNLVSYGSY